MLIKFHTLLIFVVFLCQWPTQVNAGSEQLAMKIGKTVAKEGLARIAAKRAPAQISKIGGQPQMPKAQEGGGIFHPSQKLFITLIF
jgi:hypothetical protein